MGENWGGQCDEGARQSPIDLSYAASVRGFYQGFDFSDYNAIIPNANVTNNGHSSKCSLSIRHHGRILSLTPFQSKSRWVPLRISC